MAHIDKVQNRKSVRRSPNGWRSGARRTRRNMSGPRNSRRAPSNMFAYSAMKLSTSKHLWGARRKRCKLRHACAGLACAHHRDAQAENKENELGHFLAHGLRPQPAATRCAGVRDHSGAVNSQVQSGHGRGIMGEMRARLRHIRERIAYYSTDRTH